MYFAHFQLYGELYDQGMKPKAIICIVVQMTVIVIPLQKPEEVHRSTDFLLMFISHGQPIANSVSFVTLIIGQKNSLSLTFI